MPLTFTVMVAVASLTPPVSGGVESLVFKVLTVTVGTTWIWIEPVPAAYIESLGEWGT